MKNSLKINSIAKAFRLIDCFCEGNFEYTLTELAKKVNLSIGSTQKITSTLMSSGYLAKDPKTKKYRLSPKWLSTGYAFLNHLNFRKLALPHLIRIYEETKKTVNLSIKVGDEVLYIERISTSPLITVNIRPGLKRLLYPNAMGKAILAFLSDDERHAILDRIESKISSEEAKIDRNKIENELNQIKKLGYSESRITIGGELIVLAVPIFNRKEDPFGAMNIVIPLDGELSKKEIKRYSDLLMETGNLMSNLLGYMDDISE